MAEICFKKRILAVVLIMTLLLSFVSCVRDDGARLQEYERRRAEIQLEKQSYINEQYSIRMGVEEYAGNRSFMSFVFLELDAALYTDVLPIFNDTDIPLKGVMAMSLDELPGMDGNITLDQYESLKEFGWESTIYWKYTASEGTDTESVTDASEKLDSYLEAVRTALEELEIEMPSSIVINTIIGSEYDTVLSKYGIENLLHDYEKREDLVSSEMPEGVWHSGILGWRDLLRSTRIKNQVETNGGYCSFMITFDNSPENHDTSFFGIEGESTANGERVDVFKRMITKFRDSIRRGHIEILGIAEARARARKYHFSKEEYLEYSTVRIAELDAMIADTDKRLFDLYQEFYADAS